MGIKIGDINLAEEIVDLRFQFLRLSKIFDYVIAHNRDKLTDLPNQDEMRRIEQECVEILNRRFPNMGVKRKDSGD